MMKRKTAERLGLPVKGKFIAFSSAGVPPHLMGIGPAYAIPKVLAKAGISLGNVDIFEINEAFASQAVYCVEKLGIPAEKVNPKGGITLVLRVFFHCCFLGAIAIGHPLGATGSRMIATILPELKRQGKKVGVISMCIGSGMGAAAVVEAE